MNSDVVDRPAARVFVKRLHPDVVLVDATIKEYIAEQEREPV